VLVPVGHDHPDALPLLEAPATTQVNTTVKPYGVDSFHGSFKRTGALREKHVISLVNLRTKDYLDWALFKCRILAFSEVGSASHRTRSFSFERSRRLIPHRVSDAHAASLPTSAAEILVIPQYHGLGQPWRTSAAFGRNRQYYLSAVELNSQFILTEYFET
jgi:hypothetical protein